MADFVAPLHANWLVMWGEEKDHDHMEVEFGDQVRLKTRGDSPLIGMKNVYTSMSMVELCTLLYVDYKHVQDETYMSGHVRTCHITSGHVRLCLDNVRN